MYNRGGLGITERCLNLLLSSATIKAEERVYLGDFFAIPHTHIKSYAWFQAVARLLPPGSATVLLQMHHTGFTERQKARGDGQRWKTMAALGALSFRSPTITRWSLRELMHSWTSGYLHLTWTKSLWEATMGNVLQSPFSPGWLRMDHIHTPVPDLPLCSAAKRKTCVPL